MRLIFYKFLHISNILCNFAAILCKLINLTIMKASRIIAICVLSIAVVVMGYFCVTSVTTPIKFENTKAEREVAVIKNLVDLRTALVEYHHQNGRFTADADSLLMFIKTAPKKELMKEGSLTDKQL